MLLLLDDLLVPEEVELPCLVRLQLHPLRGPPVLLLELEGVDDQVSEVPDSEDEKVRIVHIRSTRPISTLR